MSREAYKIVYPLAPARRGRRSNPRCKCCGKIHPKGSPWYNFGKGGWSLTVGKSSRLLTKADLPKDKKAHDKAFDLWEQSKSEPKPEQPKLELVLPVGQDGESLTALQICDLYLV